MLDLEASADFPESPENSVKFLDKVSTGFNFYLLAANAVLDKGKAKDFCTRNERR